MHCIKRSSLLFVLASLASFGTRTLYPALNPFTWFSDGLNISDISQTSITPISAIHKPKTIAELKGIVSNSQKPIAIAAGRFSQGGHIAYPQGIVIDITALDHVKKLDVAAKEIIVETGITWRAIQEYINPYNLSVKVMQSYNDFTVGGSLSVNVYIGVIL